MRKIHLNENIGNSNRCELKIALEEIMHASDMIQGASLKNRVRHAWMNLRGRLKGGTLLPDTYFSAEDLDTSVVDKLLNHPSELIDVYHWVYYNEHALVDKLTTAKKVLDPIIKKPRVSTYYRGVGSRDNHSSLGLSIRKRFLRDPLISVDGSNLMVGSEFIIPNTTTPIALTTNLNTAKNFGRTVFAINSHEVEESILHITMEVVYAMSLVSYLVGESRGFRKAFHTESPEKDSIYATFEEALLLPTKRSFKAKVMRL